MYNIRQHKVHLIPPKTKRPKTNKTKKKSKTKVVHFKKLNEMCKNTTHSPNTFFNVKQCKIIYLFHRHPCTCLILILYPPF